MWREAPRHVGPGAVRPVRRRAQPAVLRADRPDRGHGPVVRGRPRLRGRRADRNAGRALAHRHRARRGQLGRDAGPGHAHRPARVHRGRHRRVAAGPAGRRARVQRRVPVGPRSPRAAVEVARLAHPGRLVRLPGTGKLRHAGLRPAARAGAVAPLARPGAGRAGDPGARAGRLRRPAGRRRLHGGRLGDHVPAPARRRRPGVGVEARHRTAARPRRTVFVVAHR